MTSLMDGHIVVDDKGVARITGSRVKVIHLVMEKKATGWSAEQLHEQFPHIPLAAIYAALAYYHDHLPDVDAQIEASIKLAEGMRSETGESPLVKRLREAGKLP